MSDVSVAQAKAQFARIVHEAESGRPISITRRGRPVAVLVSQDMYERMAPPVAGLMAFTTDMRRQAAEQGLALFEEAELSGLRDQSERRPTDLR